MPQYYDSNDILTNLLNRLHECCHFTLEVAIRTMNSIVLRKEDIDVTYSSFLKVTFTFDPYMQHAMPSSIGNTKMRNSSRNLL